MSILYIDTETFSAIPLNYGLHKYLEGVELLLVSYALDDNPVRVWDVTVDTIPVDLRHFFICDDLLFCAHNSAFDRQVLYNCLRLQHTLWRDTSVNARRHSLPASLGDLCTVLRVPGDQAKIKEGRQLINLFCKPQKSSRKMLRATRKTHPYKWQRFMEYASNDISAMRIIDKALPDWNNSPTEQEVYDLDYRINNRGFKIDKVLAVKAIELLDRDKKKSDSKVKEATDGQVNTANQRDKLLNYMLNEYGVALPDLQASTLKHRIDDVNLPEEVKNLIALRLSSAKSSTRKYQTVVRSLGMGDRLRSTLTYNGASRTGRWSGRLFQPQNLPRPSFDQNMIDIGVFAIKNNCISLFFDSVTDICASTIRSLIVPESGCKLVVSDYASIEGRVLSWLAGENWKVDAYTDFDKGIGHDMYTLTYANTFGINPNDVTIKQRQIGKVLELALGYAGGVGAFVTFAKNYNINLADLVSTELPSYVIDKAHDLYNYLSKTGEQPNVPEDIFITCDGIKRMWRDSNSSITYYWQLLNDAVRDTCLTSNTNRIDGIVIDKKGAWLRIKLPSGRYLCYPGIRAQDNEITYLGQDQYTRQWTRQKTYGGKLAENVTQAVARDILAYGMLAAEKANYKIILTVHDEIVTEVPDTAVFNHDSLSKIITRKADWMAGLPLAAAGYDSYRYKK